MRTRSIGQSGLQCGVLGLGCNRLLDPRNRQMVRVIHEAIDLGMNLLDAADMYGDGRCEEFLGAALKGRRDKAVIASKFGMVRAADGAGFAIDASPAHVARACDASLKRLGFERIDLYYQHQMDLKVPIEETVGAMSELIGAGKVRALGLCNTSPDLVRRAHKVHPLAAVQMEYSLMDRKAEREILPLCRELGISFVGYGPLTYAFLTGELRAREDLPSDERFRLRQTRFSDDNLKHNYRMLSAVGMVAAEIGGTPAQVALAWCLGRPFDVLPIPGSSRLDHLRANAGATDLQLSDRQTSELESAFAPEKVKGGGPFDSGHSP